MREIALDTETTGLDPASGHRVVEIGCVEMLGQVRTGKSFHAYINPERDMPPDAERIHGISGAFLADKPVFAQIVEEFLGFLAEDALVIHNAGFDMKFINFELSRLGFAPIPFSRVVDTLDLSRKKFPGQPNNLDALCRRFEIDLTARIKHGALLDAELLADVYLELSGGRQTGLDLMQAGQGEAKAVETAKIEIPLRAFEASREEKEAHAAFLKQLKNPLWEELEEEMMG